MILTTHDMDDIEALCERVMVIGRGRLLYDGGLEELKHKYAPLRRLKVTSPNLPKNAVCIEGAETVTTEGNEMTVVFDPAKNPSYVMMERVVGFMRKNSAVVNDIVIQEQDIDEMISVMYRELAL